MYSNNTKPYYINLPSTGTGGNNGSGGTGNGDCNCSLINIFNTEVTKLLILYSTNNISGFTKELEILVNLEIANPAYKFNDICKNLVKLIYVINSLIVANDDLKIQIKNLETAQYNDLMSSKMMLTELSITQSAGIKLVYLQYLIMYDIKLTNGLFIQAYLDEAQQVLTDNGNVLQYNFD
jgi:hypothetical protein